jgi:hypothetical protein
MDLKFLREAEERQIRSLFHVISQMEVLQEIEMAPRLQRQANVQHKSLKRALAAQVRED